MSQWTFLVDLVAALTRETDVLLLHSELLPRDFLDAIDAYRFSRRLPSIIRVQADCRDILVERYPRALKLTVEPFAESGFQPMLNPSDAAVAMAYDALTINAI